MPDTLALLDNVRDSVKNLPNSRERSLVLTKLDEAEDWYKRACEVERNDNNA